MKIDGLGVGDYVWFVPYSFGSSYTTQLRNLTKTGLSNEIAWKDLSTFYLPSSGAYSTTRDLADEGFYGNPNNMGCWYKSTATSITATRSGSAYLVFIMHFK